MGRGLELVRWVEVVRGAPEQRRKGELGYSLSFSGTAGPAWWEWVSSPLWRYASRTGHHLPEAIALPTPLQRWDEATPGCLWP